jgi:hypothetical protein
VLADDIGRVIMNFDPAKAGSDPGAYWKGEYAAPPTQSIYGVSISR